MERCLERLQLASLLLDRHAEFPHPLPCDCHLVAGDECPLDSRWLVLTPLTSAMSANPIGVRAPLSWSTALAGNRHGIDRNETQRNCPPTGQ